MTHMSDAARRQYQDWALGEPYLVRLFGKFDPTRTASQQIAAHAGVGKVRDTAEFERGWNAAQSEYMAQAMKEAA